MDLVKKQPITHYLNFLRPVNIPTLMFIFLFILGSVNHLLLVTNSSLNFLIYCCMASRFRIALYDLFLNINYALCKRDKQDQSIYSQVDVINRPESNRYD